MCETIKGADNTAPFVKCSQAHRDAVVEQYRQEHEQASEELLYIYEAFIYYHYALIVGNISEHSSKYLQSFVDLFGSRECFCNIQRTLLRRYDCSDIYQEVQLALYLTAQKYVQIQFYYKYFLKWRITKMMKGLLVSGSTCSYNDCLGGKEEAVFNILDDDWVSGATATGPFTKLTPEERLMLKLRKQDQLSQKSVCNILGISRTTLIKRWKETMQKLNAGEQRKKG